MDLGIKDKNAVVTGAGRGLGRGIAMNLAKEGTKVCVISRTKYDLNDLITKMGGRENGHHAIACDLTEEGMPQKVISEVQENVGHPDIVVNNLGGPLNITDPFCSISDWRKVWRINMEVTIEINNLVIPHMRKKKWGRIINISSISAMEQHGPIPYCSIKAALTAYTRSMGRFVSPDGIIMVAVLPGAVFTEGGYWDIASKERPEHVKKYLNERMAIKRFGTIDEIATVVTFFCSEYASFCVGSIVPVDGGQGRGFFGL